MFSPRKGNGCHLRYRRESLAAVAALCTMHAPSEDMGARNTHIVTIKPHAAEDSHDPGSWEPLVRFPREVVRRASVDPRSEPWEKRISFHLTQTRGNQAEFRSFLSPPSWPHPFSPSRKSFLRLIRIRVPTTYETKHFNGWPEKCVACVWANK